MDEREDKTDKILWRLVKSCHAKKKCKHTENDYEKSSDSDGQCSSSSSNKLIISYIYFFV